MSWNRMLKKFNHRLSFVLLLQLVLANNAYAFGRDGSQQAIDGSYISTPFAKKNSAISRQYSQSGNKSLKSRSDVIQEVKRKYKAEVLKISLNERKQVYDVRVLMKNGKVRNLQIAARR